jgi:hypothetical protein
MDFAGKIFTDSWGLHRQLGTSPTAKIFTDSTDSPNGWKCHPQAQATLTAGDIFCECRLHRQLGTSSASASYANS